MAAFNFPNSPSTNDIHSENGVSFKWNGSMWNRFGPAYTDTANLNVTGIGTIAGNFHVGGVLTYEDVKNVDSVGIVTARGGLNVTANTDTDTLNVSGISTFGGVVKIPTVAGTNTNAALGVLFQTAAGVIDGGSNLTYNPGGDVLSVNGNHISINTFRGNGDLGTLTCSNHSSTTFVKVSSKVDIGLKDNTAGAFNIKEGSNEYITVDTTNSSELIKFGTAGTERLRITSGGQVNIGGNYTQTTNQLQVAGAIQCLNKLESTTGNDLLLNTGSANRDVKIQVNDVNMMYVKGDTGKIGIGIDNPGLKLHIQDGALSSAPTPNSNCDMVVEGTTSTGIQFLSSAQTQLRFGDAASTAAGAIIYSHSDDNFKLNYSNSGFLSFNNGSGEVARIKSTGEIYQYGFNGSPDTSADDLVLGNTTGGVNRGMTIWSHSSQNGSIAFADNDTNFRGAVQYLHGDDEMRFVVTGEEKYRITQHATYITPTTSGDSVNTKAGARFYTLSGATPLDGTYNSNTYTPLMRCGHSFNGTIKIWMLFHGSEWQNGCRQQIIHTQGTYGYTSFADDKVYYQNALGAGLNSMDFSYQNGGSPNYYFKVRGTWASGQNTPYILWTWTGSNSEYPYAL